MRIPFLTINDVELKSKRVLIREDFNVPMNSSGAVQSDLRIRAALPGITQALNAGATVLLMSHLGRPVPGDWVQEYSLLSVATSLENLLQQPVKFVKDWIDGFSVGTDKIFLLENVRFLRGETENDPILAQKMANLCDVFMLDAFGSAHRAHASTVGIIHYAHTAIGGPLLTQEVIALDKIIDAPSRPVVAVIGGAKVSSKFEVLTALVTEVNTLIIGGGMANTFLAAQGFDVGASLYEKDLMPMADKILSLAELHNCQILLPIDVVTQDGRQKSVNTIAPQEKIMDIGSKTVLKFQDALKSANTILWNGPMGVIEDPLFMAGTRGVASAIANSHAYSVAGGGETLAAIDQFGLADQISYISTGGGAFLEYLEGKRLPAINALIQKSEDCVKTN